jgi:hypothetical protein
LEILESNSSTKQTADMANNREMIRIREYAKATDEVGATHILLYRRLSDLDFEMKMTSDSKAKLKKLVKEEVKQAIIDSFDPPLGWHREEYDPEEAKMNLEKRLDKMDAEELWEKLKNVKSSIDFTQPGEAWKIISLPRAG